MNEDILLELIFLTKGLAQEKDIRIEKSAFDKGWLVVLKDGQKFQRKDIHAVLNLILAIKDKENDKSEV